MTLPLKQAGWPLFGMTKAQDEEGHLQSEKPLQ